MNRIDALGGKPCATLSSGTPSALGAAAFSRVHSGGFTRVRNAALIAGVSAYALVLGPVASDPAANVPNFSQTTPGAISTTVPDGICAMTASVTGGSGASSGTSAAITGGRGAGGAIVGATFRVLPAQSVTGAVASGGTVSLVNGGTSFGGTGTAAGGNGGTVTGSPFHRGGGGGGSSSISVASLKLVEAGGGGGGGGAHQSTPTGDGGGGGFAGIGAGTVAIGVNGSAGFQAAGITVGAGQGGQAAAGGTGGVHSATPARNGTGGSGIGVGTGGAGGPDNGVDSGGGGGGGYTGGGGGAATQINAVTGGGGGGGSSFVRGTSPTAAATVPSGISGSGAAQTGISAVNGAAGAITIDWVPCVYTLSVTKSASPAPVNAGARTIWTVAVANSGPDPMTRGDTISLADTLPAGPIGSPTPTLRVLTIATSGTGTDTNLDSGAMTCTGVTVGASMPSSTVCSRPYSALLAPGAPTGGVRGLNSGETLTITYEQIFANTATATSITNVASTVDRSSTTGTTDIIGVNANRSGSGSVSILPYDLQVTKSASAATVGAGQTFTWTINVTNNGPGDMQGPNETAANPLVVSDVAPTTNVSTPASFTSSGPATGCTYVTPFNTINCTSGLASGQTQTFTFQQTVNAGAPGNAVISNTASVTDYTTAGGEGSDSSAASITVSAADLAVTKTDGVTSVDANGTTSYTVVVTNNGPSSVTGAILTDAAASGLSKTSVACAATPGQCTAGMTPSIAQLEAGYALPTLASGQTYQLTVNVNVTALSGNVSNIATIAAPSGTSDPTPGNNSANDTNSVTPVADLSITKTNGTTSVNAGGTTSYTITVTNGGPSSVTGATLTDAAVAGLTKTSVACSATPGQCVSAPSVASLEAGVALPALASGQTYQLTVAASVTATSGSVANAATIAVPSGTTDPGAGNNSATDTDTVTPVADLSITKTNGATSVDAGGTTSYTITVTNGGPSSVTGATLADPAVAGLTKTSVVCSATPGQCASAPSIASLESGFALPALANGQTYQITVAASVTALSGSVANTATIAVPSGTTDPGAGNNSATDTDTVAPVADLSITKTDGVSSVDAGGTTSYTVTVTNGGPSSVTGATLADPAVAGLTKTSVVCSGTPGQCVTAPSVASLEAGFALPALASAQTYQITVAANVTATSGSVANTATIAVPSGTTDPGAGNNSATDTNTVTPVADLAVTKTNGVGSVTALGTTSYTVTVTNNGPSAVTGAMLTDPVASGLTVTSVACSATPGQCALLSTPTIIQLQAGYALPALASGQTYQLTVNATVTVTSGSVANTATIAVPTGTTDPTGGNDSVTDTDTVAGVADLAVTKTDGVASVNAGGSTSYTLTVMNVGPSAVTGATLSDPLATGLTVTSVACAAVPGQCTAGTTPTIAQLQAGYALPALSAGQTFILTVDATVTATGGNVTNSATIAVPSGVTDPVSGNDTATDMNAVTPVSELEITKTNGVSVLDAGGTTTYTITVTNNGPAAATGAILADPAVSGLTVNSIACSATPGECTAGTTPTAAELQGGYALPALASGQTYQLLVTFNVTATSGTVSNVATIAPPVGTLDTNLTNNIATDADAVTPVADLSVTKSNGASSVNAGGTTSYTVTVTNGGPSPVTGATLTDPAVSGLTVTSVVCSATPGQCTAGTTPTVVELHGGYALPALAGGQTYQITVAATVTATTGNVSNVVSIAPPLGTIDPAPGNDSATDTDAVNEISNLVTVKTRTSATATPSVGDTVTFQIAVTNNGPSAATNVSLTDSLPADLTANGLNGTVSQGSYNAGTGLWTAGSLANGATATLTLSGTVNTGQGGLAITNTTTAAVTPDQTDPTAAGDDLNEAVNVLLPPIVAADDSVGGVNGASGATNAVNAFTGDTLNGVAATAATTTLTVATGFSVPAGLTFNPATGNVSVSAGTAAGIYSFDYTICEIANPTNCDNGTISVTVVAAPIVAADDSVGGVNGASGAANVLNAFTGDTLNGSPGTAANATLAVATGFSVPAGLTFNTATGNVSAAAGTAVGTYSFDYTICEILNPTNCDNGTISVTVVAAPIVAADDSAAGVNGASGAANVINAFTGDALNGAAATAANTTLTVATGFSVPAGLTFDTATGNVSVAAGTAAGSYTFDYTICEILNPTNCDNGTISITVTAAPIVAANDSVAGVNGASGAANILNAFTGDTLNGVAATAATTTLTVATGFSVPAGLTFNTATGNVSVAAGTAAGTYAFDYTVCEILNPTNCDNGTISVTVAAAPIVAANDGAGGVNGASGAANVLNAFTGDTLNGAPATAANTTLTVATGFSVPAALTFDTATGNVSVAAGTVAGIYTFDYTICEILNPANCDNGTISVTVTAAPVMAADDSAGGVNGASGASNVLNAFAGDTVNGAPATAVNATLTVATGFSVPAGLIFDTATGNVSVAAGTAVGTYSFDYTICESLNPTNCDNGTISVTVIAAPIVANNDTPPAVVSGIGDANLINAFGNDTLNGAPVNIAAITATVTVPASNPGVSLDTGTGVVSVAAGVPAGDYTIQYQICETLNPANCSSATISVHVDPAVSAVTGTVYTDSNGNQTLDTGEPRQPNWIVEIFRNGTLAGTTTTNGTGDYTFTGLTSGPGYSIQFRNPENNVVFDVITGLTLADNTTVIDQNLPIDPSGVVYDSLTRNPVAGAVLTMVDSGGAPLPSACFLSATQQGQQTGASGQYQFDIIPGAAAQCPVGETIYRIVVTPPGGYSSPSTVLVPQAGPFDPTGLPSPALVGSSATAPGLSDPTVYYLSFRLASGDPDVIFNHIPIDPFLNRPPLSVTKTSVKRTASVGDLVPYTITVRNAEAVQRAGVTIVDILPPGFKYVPGSATVNGVPGEPAVANRELTWTNQIIPANGSVVYKLMLVVGAGVTGGDRTNTGLARNGADNSEISNRGQAVVAIVASTVFDCSEIIGKVFDDRNGNGYQDEGEPGIPSARLATVNGLLATTDEFGRYHITCVAVPNALIGSNFVLKLDPRSVPAGYAPTIDNPQSIRLTRGKMSELNFGVKKADVREVNLDARAFVLNGTALKPELAAKLKLLAGGNPQPLVVRVNYRLGVDEDAGFADVRLTQLKADIDACFGAAWGDVRPIVETNMNRGEPTP